MATPLLGRSFAVPVQVGPAIEGKSRLTPDGKLMQSGEERIIEMPSK